MVDGRWTDGIHQQCGHNDCMFDCILDVNSKMVDFVELKEIMQLVPAWEWACRGRYRQSGQTSVIEWTNGRQFQQIRLVQGVNGVV